MDFPRYVFTSEGEEKCKFGTYGTALVEDEDEFKAALKAGYVAVVTDLFKEEIAAKEVKQFKVVKTFKEPEPEKKVDSDSDDFDSF